MRETRTRLFSVLWSLETGSCVTTASLSGVQWLWYLYGLSTVGFVFERRPGVKKLHVKDRREEKMATGSNNGLNFGKKE